MVVRFRVKGLGQVELGAKQAPAQQPVEDARPRHSPMPSRTAHKGEECWLRPLPGDGSVHCHEQVFGLLRLLRQSVDDAIVVAAVIPEFAVVRVSERTHVEHELPPVGHVVVLRDLPDSVLNRAVVPVHLSRTSLCHAPAAAPGRHA